MFALYPHLHPEHGGYGLKSLQTDFIQLLATCFEQYADCHAVFFDHAFKSRKERRAELARANQLSGKNSLPAIKTLTKNLLQDYEVLNHQESRRQKARILTETMFPQSKARAETPYAGARLAELEQRWEYHGNFAHFGDNALLRAYHQLGYIQQYIVFALEELNLHVKRWGWFQIRIPQPVQESYHAYLTTTLATIEAEQQRIAASLYERLKTAAQNQDLRANDVLMHTVNQLQEIHSKPIPKTDAKAERGLTPDLFQQFHEIIFYSGTEIIKKRTLELPWFRSPDSSSAEHCISPALQPCATPTTDVRLFFKKNIAHYFNLEQHLPSTSRKPQWLFVGHNLRHGFFDTPYDWACLCVAQERLETVLDGNRDETALQQLYHELARVDGHLRALHQKTAAAKQQLSGFLRRRFTRQTQQFLATFQSTLTRIQQQQQEKLQLYLCKVEHSIQQNLLVPDKTLNNTLQAIRALAICDTPALAQTFNSMDATIAGTRQQYENAQIKAQQIAAYKALLAPLQIQSRENPATSAEVTALLDAYLSLQTRDDVSKVLLDGLDTLVIQARQDFTAPEWPPTTPANDLRIFENHMTCLTHLGRCLLAAGKLPERRQVSEITDDILFQYVKTWANGDTTHALPMASRHAIAAIQERFILTFGDTNAVKLVTHSQALRSQERYGELHSFTAKHLLKYEHHMIDRLLSRHFEGLEKALMQYLYRKHSLGLSEASMRYISGMATQMADAHVRNINDLENLGAADRGFFGLGSTWFNPRKCLQTAVNILAQLKITAKQLPLTVNQAQRQQLLEQLQQEIQTKIADLADPQLTQQLLCSAQLFTRPAPSPAPEKRPEANPDGRIFPGPGLLNL